MLQEFIDQLSANRLIDWLAFIFGLAQVALAWKHSKYNFIAGIISVALYIYIFAKAGLYAESVLNIYYLIISVYGVLAWQQASKQQAVGKANAKQWTNTQVIFITAFLLQSYILKKYTDSTVPYIDSLVSSIAWAGTYLLTQRKIENWILLNISNAMAIPLFVYKNLYLVALLYLLFFIIAIFAYLQWKKDLEAQ